MLPVRHDDDDDDEFVYNGNVFVIETAITLN